MTLLNQLAKLRFKRKRSFSPFDVPELVELILSFLSQHTLCHSASLVNRQWNSIARSLVPRHFTWTLSMGSLDLQPVEFNPKHAFADLEAATILTITESKHYMRHWDALQPAVTALPERWESLLQELDTCSKRQHGLRIRELRLMQFLHPTEDLLPLLDIIGTRLTNLHISDTQDLNIPLNSILVRCPGLMELDLTCGHWFATIYSRDGDQAIPPVLRLRSLRLGVLWIDEATLLSILASCPYLEHLGLNNLYTTSGNFHYGQPRIANPASLDRNSLLERVAGLCPRLNSFGMPSALTSYQLADALDMLPRVKHLSLVSDWICYRKVTTLTRQQNTLTTLEITNHNNSHQGLGLHRYLCQSPHLLHLKALDVDLSIAYLDLEGVLPYSKGPSRGKDKHRESAPVDDILPDSMIRKIWACRSLRTLHLGLNRKKESTIEDGRMVFSYISKVCPSLEDVIIRRRSLVLSLEGGFCLLSRLQALQTLKFVVKDSSNDPKVSPPPSVKQRDLAWISKEISWKHSMHMVLLLWLKPRSEQTQAKSPFQSPKKERSVQRETNVKKTETRKRSRRQGPDYMISGIDMRDTGHLRDVCSLFEKRSGCCWPMLEYVGIMLEKERLGVELSSLARWIKFYRPTSDVGCWTDSDRKQ